MDEDRGRELAWGELGAVDGWWDVEGRAVGAEEEAGGAGLGVEAARGGVSQDTKGGGTGLGEEGAGVAGVWFSPAPDVEGLSVVVDPPGGRVGGGGCVEGVLLNAVLLAGPGSDAWGVARGGCEAAMTGSGPAVLAAAAAGARVPLGAASLADTAPAGCDGAVAGAVAGADVDADGSAERAPARSAASGSEDSSDTAPDPEPAAAPVPVAASVSVASDASSVSLTALLPLLSATAAPACRCCCSGPATSAAFAAAASVWEAAPEPRVAAAEAVAAAAAAAGALLSSASRLREAASASSPPPPLPPRSRAAARAAAGVSVEASGWLRCWAGSGAASLLRPKPLVTATAVSGSVGRPSGLRPPAFGAQRSQWCAKQDKMGVCGSWIRWCGQSGLWAPGGLALVAVSCFGTWQPGACTTAGWPAHSAAMLHIKTP